MKIRERVLEALLDVDYGGGFSNLVTKEVLADGEIDPKDKNLYLKLVYGCLQNEIYLDALISRYTQKKLDPEVRENLRIAFYQLYFLDKVPDYAVVNEAVNLMGKRRRSAKGFVNGVLRSALKDGLLEIDWDAYDNEKEVLSVRYSIPLWIIYKYYETFGREKAESIIPLMNDTAPLTLRNDSLRGDRDKLIADLAAFDIRARAGELDSDAVVVEAADFAGRLQETPLYRQGRFTVQDQGAMAIVRRLDPQPGEKVLDMCAAPGGKSTHLAQLMNNEGLVVARDVYENRLRLVAETAKRMGTTIVETRLSDGREVSAAEAGAYDRVLLDAPCSGLGIIRRKPEIRYRLDKAERKALVTLQRELLAAAAQLLKAGGTLVYSTCTVNRDENRGNVDFFLTNHPDFELVSDEMTSPLDDGADCFYLAILKRKA